MAESRRLPLIPAAKVKSGKHSVLQATPDLDGPLIKGESGTGIEWLCGSCDTVLVTGAKPGQVNNVVLRCTCGAYNHADI